MTSLRDAGACSGIRRSGPLAPAAFLRTAELLCLLCPMLFPGSAGIFKGTKQSLLGGLLRANRPLESELHTYPCYLVFELSIAASILSRNEGVLIRGRTQMWYQPAEPIMRLSCFSLGNFQGRFCCLFPPAKLICLEIHPLTSAVTTRTTCTSPRDC